MMLHLIAIIASAVVLIAGYLLCRLKQANNEINRLFETNKTLQAEQKIAQTQINHFKARKTHEENANRTDRNGIIDRLQQSNDLRD
ncbi:DUF2681 domain-containing protein [Pasteurella multocida]|uniref:DUF2681 domain-containing protein n=1 Tax=Pasteurella multocida TaxID=747 RepID=UPI00021455B0|nr:DUF2681 domain-containing protein [Pasteurella multocida]EGP03149.1 hypothetical protein GEW_12486 [Pasteurella multocida subsp. gallicida str. Anand1_poultry]MDY0489265.1 DUF2681 domain-containing protein [Pasteurella multocida]MDY0595827.1 DUF2681 domain-containing protein [Pasteurella multocida]MDY0665212.1 DUF2681 domain-containing protein [Pasteurella multocida]MDY0667325.1 DUF2681 domain-containing protein [Pasteurella multocida]